MWSIGWDWRRFHSRPNDTVSGSRWTCRTRSKGGLFISGSFLWLEHWVGMACRVTFRLRGVWNIDACLCFRKSWAFGGEKPLFTAAPTDTKHSQRQKKRQAEENQHKIKAAL